MLRVALLAAALLALNACSRPSAVPQESEADVRSSAFRVFVDDYFKASFELNPSSGTAAGFHEYDDRLESFSPAEFTKRIEALKSFQTRLDALRAKKLTEDENIDAQVLDNLIKGELLELQSVQSWRRNPMLYVGTPGGAIDGLMKRDFAPAPERLRSVISRVRAIPALLDNMQANIADPPKEFTDLAIRMARGSVGFFRDTVAEWAKTAAGSDTTLLKDFETANRNAVGAMEKATAWLEKDLKPRSKGKYAIGSDIFAAKLYYEEMVDIPLARVLEIGEANLNRDYRAFVETAKKIAPGKSPAEVMQMISNEHPTEQNLLDSAKSTVQTIRQFIVDKKIITIPSEVLPTVTETPPFARTGTFAAMDTPGAYERKAKEAFYYITPPEKEWTARHKEEHLRLFNRPVMDIITIHEAYPGHYTQFLYARQFPTKTRKLASCGTNAEGWAHYTEQMMLEEGFGGGDPKIKLAQLSEALLRDCRYVVGIKLHTQGMTVEQGARVFVERGFQEPANAYEEARRGAYNPTYLYYTLGKLQIYKLREDYRVARGDRYSLGGFHDEFVKQGAIPIKLIRQIMLPGDGRPTL